MYKKRHIESLLKELERMYSAVLVIGSRQVGKTTLLEEYTALKKVSLDDSLTLSQATEEPTSFLKSHPTPVLIDEVQKAPDLFSQIKYEIDRDRTKKGQFYMTGSEQPKLLHSVSESLSGRLGIAKLFGLSLRELSDSADTEPFLPTADYLDARKYRSEHCSDAALWNLIHRGSMPELLLNPDFRWDIFYSAYVSTYIERDVRSELGADNELKFTKFLVSCAAMCGELLNLSALARNVGVSQPTAERWLTKLCETNVVYLLRPYYTNIRKRVVKTPKLYFTDTGLAAYLTRWTSPEALQNGAFAGHLFENYVVMEIVKSYYNHSPAEPELYFYRDSNQKEIDLLILENGILHPLEIKLTADPEKKQTRAFAELDNLSDAKRGSGGIICRREHTSMIDDDNFYIPVELL